MCFSQFVIAGMAYYGHLLLFFYLFAFEAQNSISCPLFSTNESAEVN